MADEYKSNIKKLDNSTKLIKFFRKFDHFKRQNQNAGQRKGDYEWAWRLIWLCEFANWISKENIPRRPFGHGDEGKELVDNIKKRYRGYNKAQGSLWVDDSGDISEVISSIENEFDGEVWVWNSDLSYLINQEKFEDVYKPNIGPTKEVKIITGKSNWANKIKGKERDYIRKNLEELDPVDRKKIRIKFVSDKKINENLTTTIFGMNSKYFTNNIMLVRPIISPDPNEQKRIFSSFIFPNVNPHKNLIKHICEAIKDEFEGDKGFTSLYQVVET